MPHFPFRKVADHNGCASNGRSLRAAEAMSSLGCPRRSNRMSFISFSRLILAFVIECPIAQVPAVMATTMSKVAKPIK